jgi:DNA-binding transcriptional ArsR family regulator
LRFPLSYIFGTETNVRILRELARHGGQLTPSNLAARTKMALPSVIAALSSLGGTSVVKEVGTGRTRLYNLNQASPFSAPIQALFKAEEDRFAGIIDAVRDCAASFGEAVIASWVFGSTARGEDQSESDVDIAFVTIHDDDVACIQNRGIDALSASAEKLMFSPSINTFSVTDLKRLRDSGAPLWKAFLGRPA